MVHDIGIPQNTVEANKLLGSSVQNYVIKLDIVILSRGRMEYLSLVLLSSQRGKSSSTTQASMIHFARAGSSIAVDISQLIEHVKPQHYLNDKSARASRQEDCFYLSTHHHHFRFDGH